MTICMLALLLVASGCWRLGADLPAVWWTAVVASAMALIVAVAAGLQQRRQDTATQMWPALLLTGALLCTVLAPLGLWPCETNCKGAKDYAYLFGIHLSLLAPWPLTVVAALAWLHHLAPQRWTGLARDLAILGGAGCSLYFIHLAARLGLDCPYCFAIHTWMLAAGALLVATATTLWQPLLLPITGALLLHFAIHPETDRLQPSQAPAAGLDRDNTRILLAAHTNRMRGRLDAPIKADLVIDYQCQHCKDSVPQAIADLQTLIAAGQLRITIRARFANQDAGSKRLVILSLIAAAYGQLDDYLTAMLGTPINLDAAAVDARLPNHLKHLAKRAELLTPAIGTLLQIDDYKLARSNAKIGRTPMLYLRYRGDNIRNWSGTIPIDEVTAAVDQILAPSGP